MDLDLTTSNRKAKNCSSTKVAPKIAFINLLYLFRRNIRSVENLSVGILALGEGWHNYHHTFPWDYKTSEFGDYSLNLTNAFIDFFAWIGWAYDLKTVCPEVIKSRVQRTGDGSHELWGWGDKDITKEDKEATIIS